MQAVVLFSTLGGVVAIAAACSSSVHAPSPAASAVPSQPPIPTSSAVPGATATPTPPPSTVPATTLPTPPEASPTPAVEKATVVYRGNPARRAVALTFDAGADAGNTVAILETLRQEGIRATFGITGRWAEQNRDLLISIAADGHQIINHTYDHASFTGASTGASPLTPEQRALELSRAEVSVYHFTQRSTRPYFRPPYGDLDDSVLRAAAANGYTSIIMWTVDTLGWKGATAAAIVQRSVAQAEPGAIYIMHVGAESQDAAALPRIITALRAANYTFTTVDNLLSP